MAYAKGLTKERLLQEGFTEITKDGRLFKGDREVFPSWNGKESNPNRYLCIYLSKRDSDGHLIKGTDRKVKYTRKDGSIAEYKSWAAKLDTFGLHRVIWAWHYGEVPAGFVVDHINNKHSRIEDYHLDNLQLLTPGQNIRKERICNIKEVKCQLNKPRSFYEDKLNKYLALYESAKINKDAKAAQKLRGNISQTRARLRYYDSHMTEVEMIKQDELNKAAEKANKIEYKKDLAELASWKKYFKETGNKSMWRECIKVEKVIQAKKDDAALIIRHALDVLHKTFAR